MLYKPLEVTLSNDKIFEIGILGVENINTKV